MRRALSIALSIASVLLLMLFFRYIGVKGALGFFTGLGVMAYLILSKNPMLMGIIRLTSSDEFIEDIKKR